MSLVQRVREGVNVGIFESDLKEKVKGTKLEKLVLWENSIGTVSNHCAISGVPSQCGMCCLHDFMGQVDVTETLKIGEKIAKWLGYTQILATFTSVPRIESAEKYGFKMISEFINYRTGNKVKVLVKDIER